MKVTTEQCVPQAILDRYDIFLRAITDEVSYAPEPGTAPSHLRWMLTQIPTFTDEGKAGRWLGFIQANIIAFGLTTVQIERDFTRPFFLKTPVTQVTPSLDAHPQPKWPTTPGFYWAKWRLATDETHEGDLLTPSTKWEVVEVWDNNGAPGTLEELGVSVPGVRETQWRDQFYWGPEVAPHSPK